MTTADDFYDRFYTEKLWELIPSIHRHEDGAPGRGALRALVEIIAEQAALLRRSQDRLWDDAFIDLCDDWAVPYLGELVATRMVSALNRRGRRVDVAKTVYYRRRKGTPRVLEELIADICGWEGKVVESFRFLGRARHRLDPRLDELATPAPGWADLRRPRLAEQTDGPWDPFAHTPDLRRARGRDGRWNLPRVTFHLFRLASVELEGVVPHVRAGGDTFTFDPSGRDVPLFMPRQRAAPRRRDGADVRYDWEQWTSAQPWQVPAPMGCRVLGHAEYELDRAILQQMADDGVSPPARAELEPLLGRRFESEAALRRHLGTLATAAELLAVGNWDRLRERALIDACGKAALYPDAVEILPAPPVPVRRERVAAGSLDGFALAVPADADVLVDPVLGRLRFATAPAEPGRVRVRYWYGLGGPIGAGGHDRRATVVDVPDVVVPAASGAITAAQLPPSGVTELGDSATYTPAATANPAAVVGLIVQAANFARPYVRLGNDWIFTAAAGEEAELVLDGLWIGTRVAAGASLVVRGMWSKIVLRHCTLDPGGVDVDGVDLPPVRLWIEGPVDQLRVERCITAAIGLRGAGRVDELVVADSILDGTRSGGIALASTPGCVELARVTALGGVDVERLYATDTLITGAVDVTDTQQGCFRFSAAPAGSRLPHPYRRVMLTPGPLFGSMRFGDPDYAWLAETAPAALHTGGEHGTEIGAWSAEMNPIKLDSLRRKVEEYLPFGLSPAFVRET